ncbi:MAG: hypothetical protein FWH21_08580, partial [Kiritimatiellaeota bacterium]|nr:hypothetical protein [Kiritimatiellota bacterium]
PLRLHRDMQISGVHTLALTGPPGAFRVWVSASTNGTPLLECGQTVSSTYYSTFVPDTENDMWLEALLPGEADLTFAFTGTVNALGINHQDTLKITTITVSIVPDSMEGLVELDDGDDDPRTRVFAVSVAGQFEIFPLPVTVRAKFTPEISTDLLPAGWTLQGGDGADPFERTISRWPSPSKTEFTFSCNDSDSGAKTTIYVYNARLGLYADAGASNLPDVGHSWTGLYLDEDARELLINKADEDYLTEIGFWPSISGNPFCPGAIRLGAAAHEYHLITGAKEYPISIVDLREILPRLRNGKNNPPDYNLLTFNCTDFAILLGENVKVFTMSSNGISTPWIFSNWLNTH